ncbi:CUE domain protein [Fusarium subglutinans]|uniref:CUE domain protein n=1 Tax=Gibberella subglutinans TaxID=42677 RepID=A0A8H5V6T7_GIBSU|nr:CUE domain protein [Fusarium subglutinans]KAF5612691.1 CUE domain protein [Fusarium subglutinans]
MSAPGETNKATAESGPESPTTARPLDLDDDDVQESGVLDSNTTPTAATNTTTTQAQAQAPSPTNETAPPKPPRPVSEAQKNETILKEAFPTVELSVIKAVLRASGGRVEPAFHALLEMTDPDAAQNEPVDEVPPPQPPRPQNRTQMSQLEADELYARQLAEHYDNVGAYESRTANRGQRQGQQGQDEWGDGREHSFIDDDLPVIRENLRKGFFETQEKVNGWITNIKKKIEENFDESEEQTQRQGEPFRRPGESSRRSGDYDRYDADPQVLSDDFAGMKFSSDGTPMNRPMANTGMYKPPPPSTSPKPSNGRRVGFKEETEEINMYDSSPRVPPKDAAPTSGTRGSKWQPMSAVEPSPIAENDPFSLGDSEDERETHQKSKDDKTDDSERLKKATAEAMADSLSESKETEAKKN